MPSRRSRPSSTPPVASRLPRSRLTSLPAWRSLGVVWCLLAGVAHADVLELVHGGTLRGEWLNKNARSPAEYVMRTESGAELHVPAELVKQAIRRKPAELEYETLAPTFADTVAEQWKLAEWCRQKQLPGPRATHLRRILELDDRFAPAWYALGYSQLGGRWQRTAESNRERGYELHRGRWRLAQEIELVDEQLQVKAAQDEWRKRVNQLRGASDSPGRVMRVYAELSEIRDPHALPALVAAYAADRRPGFRRAVVQTIGRIEGPAANTALFNVAMSDGDSEIFFECIERLEARRPADLVESCVQALHSGHNGVVNRAAYLLGRLGDRSAIPALIEVLTTRHWVQAGKGNAAGYSATFGRAEQSGDAPAGAGLSKSQPQWIEVWTRNQDVLDALIKLSGGANFSYSTPAWRVWYASTRQ